MQDWRLFFGIVLWFHRKMSKAWPRADNVITLTRFAAFRLIHLVCTNSDEQRTRHVPTANCFAFVISSTCLIKTHLCTFCTTYNLGHYPSSVADVIPKTDRKQLATISSTSAETSLHPARSTLQLLQRLRRPHNASSFAMLRQHHIGGIDNSTCSSRSSSCATTGNGSCTRNKEERTGVGTNEGEGMLSLGLVFCG